MAQQEGQKKPVRVRLFGTFEFTVGGKDLVKALPPKSRYFLALLALWHGPIQRAQIGEMLWPDSPNQRVLVRKSLQDLNRELEMALGGQSSVLLRDSVRDATKASKNAKTSADTEMPDSITRRATLELKLSESEADIVCFDEIVSPTGDKSRLEKAVALYERGQLLPGYEAPWIEEARRKREGEYKAALEILGPRVYGREQEIERIQDLLLGEYRLVTLTDPPGNMQGGIGKTRLLLALPARLGEQFHVSPLIDLGDVSLDENLPGSPEITAERCLEKILRGLGGHPNLKSGCLDQIVQLYEQQRSSPGLDSPDNTMPLLLLDNAGPIAEAAIKNLLQRVPDLKCVVASRRGMVLGEPDVIEARVALESLLDLRPEGPGSLKARGFKAARPEESDRLAQHPDVKLFVDRAFLAQPEFRLDEDDTQALETVKKICQLAGGAPLAIELVAVWMRYLELNEVLEHLEKAVQAGDAHERLQVVIEQSYGFLDRVSPVLQTFFAKLSVFPQAWTTEEAGVICEEPAAEHRIRQLEIHSLVTSEKAGDEKWFRLAGPLRDFAKQQLEVATNRRDTDRLTAAMLAGRHAQYYLRMVEGAEPEMQGIDQGMWFERLERTHTNIQLALSWFRNHEPGRGIRLASGLMPFWRDRCHYHEGRVQIQSMLERLRADSTSGNEILRDRSHALRSLASLLGEEIIASTPANQSVDLAEPLRYCEEALKLSDKAQDRIGEAESLLLRGSILNGLNHIDAAHRDVQKSLRLFEECGQKRGVSRALFELGLLELNQQNYKQAEVYLGKSLVLMLERGDLRGTAGVIGSLAIALHKQQKFEDARTRARDSLTRYRPLGDEQGLLVGVVLLARIEMDLARTQGTPEKLKQAAHLVGIAEAIQKVNRWPPREQLIWGDMLQLLADGVPGLEAIDLEALLKARSEGREEMLSKPDTALDPFTNL